MKSQKSTGINQQMFERLMTEMYAIVYIIL